MVVMILCWCLCRMTWVTITVSLYNDIRFVFLAWPVTWTLSAILLILYALKAHWIPNEESIY